VTEPRKIVIEVPPPTAEALDRMAASLGCTPEEAAERILTAAAIKLAHTLTPENLAWLEAESIRRTRPGAVVSKSDIINEAIEAMRTAQGQQEGSDQVSAKYRPGTGVEAQMPDVERDIDQ